MFIVRFVRNDGFPNEDYYYACLKDAEYHYNLYEGDTSQLYSVLQLLETDSDKEKVRAEHFFSNEKKRV